MSANGKGLSSTDVHNIRNLTDELRKSNSLRTSIEAATAASNDLRDEITRLRYASEDGALVMRELVLVVKALCAETAKLRESME
jgi:hypothetical protein